MTQISTCSNSCSNSCSLKRNDMENPNILRCSNCNSVYYDCIYCKIISLSTSCDICNYCNNCKNCSDQNCGWINKLISYIA